MRILIVIAAFAIVGCAPTPSLEQLEAQAEVTGDWSDVERYERAMVRRETRNGRSCPTGQISYCEAYFGMEECRCVDGDKMNAYLRLSR